MIKSEIEKKVCEIIKTYCLYDEDTIELDVDLRDSYGIESIALVELLVDIESQFDIMFDNSFLTYESFSTAGNLANYIDEKMNCELAISE